MESLFMEVESAMNLRRSSFSSALSNNQSNMYGGFGFKSSQNAYNYSLHHPSVGSASQLLVNTSNNMMVGPAPAPASFRGGSIPATSLISLYSSLPPFPLHHHQPPLLPLPMKSATMPSSTKKITTPPSAISRSSSTAARQSNQKRKKKQQQQQQQQAKPSTSPKKEPAAEQAPKPMENKPAKKEEEEEDTEEEFLIGSATTSKSVSSVYSLSPPPSSLPLPRLLLMRPRRSAKVAAVASSCIAEAMAGVDAGATDDLRKLLRL